MAKRRKASQRSNAPLIAIGAGVLILVGLLVYLAIAGSNNGGNVNTQDLPYPEVERVSLVDAGRAHSEQSAVFLDVRDADSYAARHVSGAINMPIGELESRAGELDKNRWIITYCT